MEILGVLVPLVECISPRIAKRWEYHRDFNKNREALREALNKLNCRKTDISTGLDAKVVEGETEESSEVTDWLERVKKICQECEDIEKEVRDVKFFSRASLGKKFAEKKVKVDELYQEGEFSEGDLVKTLPRRGEELQLIEIRNGETTTEKKREEIWSCLLDEEVTKIGVYGMGGSGKTTILEHINNRLLKEKDKFDKVIWVTVSKATSVISLQDKIAGKFQDLDISKDNDEEARATKLYNEFRKQKRCVLILDDMWKAYSLKKVGIPEPTPENGCKLVLTTRSHDVCREMSCEPIIKMELISEEEALKLFIERVGLGVSSNPKLEKLVEQVAHECARLPLAIVTVAGSLRDKHDFNEWVIALADLKDATASSISDITEVLRFSYDRLKNETYRDCVLYCALYSEDYPIERNQLIDELIAVGIVEKIEERKRQISRSQAMLNELISVSLLNDIINDEKAKCVKMHDLIRDMAITIMRKNPCRFLVKAGDESKSIPNEESWNEGLEVVSLMGNKIVEIPSSTKPPKCPRISTLFLNSNSHLKSIPNDFFLHMNGLNVLDLSHTSIKELPRSVSDLVNLAVLLLRKCRELTNVLSLANLKNMTRLDFYDTRINKVPEGIEKLIKLTYLNLSRTNFKSMPDGILCKLTNLQHLSICPFFISSTLRSEELSNLRKLETLQVPLIDVNGFNECVRFFEGGELTDWMFERRSKFSILDVKSGHKQVFLSYCDIIHESETAKAGGFPLLLPKNIESLRILGCRVNVSSLCQLTSLECTT